MGWFILLAIVGLLCLLLASPIRLKVDYQGEWKVKGRYLLIPFQIVPRRRKKEKQNAQPPEPAEKQPPADKRSPLRELLKERGWKGFLSLLRQIAKAAAGGGKVLFRHLKIDPLVLHITVGGPDAAQTAIRYGTVCAGVYPAAGAIAAVAKCKTPDVSVQADFENPDVVIDFHTRLSISLFFALRALGTAVLRFLSHELTKQKTSP